MRTRIAGLSEAPAITSLINAAFVVEKFFVDGDRIDVGQVLAFFDKGEFLVADGDDGLAACVYIQTGGERGYLGLLSVDPSLQGQGLGKRMVQAAEDRCRERGCRFMDLRVVNLRQELPGFYRALGYQEDGTEPFPEDSPTKLPCHFVRMFKPL